MNVSGFVEEVYEFVMTLPKVSRGVRTMRKVVSHLESEGYDSGLTLDLTH